MLYNQCLETAKPNNLNFNDTSQSFQRMDFEWKAQEVEGPMVVTTGHNHKRGLTYINLHNLHNV